VVVTLGLKSTLSLSSPKVDDYQTNQDMLWTLRTLSEGISPSKLARRKVQV